MVCPVEITLEGARTPEVDEAPCFHIALPSAPLVKPAKKSLRNPQHQSSPANEHSLSTERRGQSADGCLDVATPGSIGYH